ncbi:hypothetical protein [Aeoliella sp. SH292]|uniref:hypothetical protein n=1 Tax=Aeoliella sp. SH292 TaxID=3454464 RepID=UPI003F9D0DE6
MISTTRVACWAAACIAAISHCSPALAVNQNLNLQLLPTTTTTNRLTVKVTTNGMSDSELTRASGNILSTIGYDIFEGLPLVHSIRFTGGSLALNGATTSNVVLNLGNFIVGLDIVGAGLGGRLDTPSPPSLVTNGSFNTADHLVRINTGTLTATGRGLLGSINETINLSTDPLDLQTQGTSTIAVAQTATAGLNRTFEVTLQLPVDATELITDPTDITIEVDGTVTARSTFTVAFPLEGDYNGDGEVNLADYTVWRDSLGATGKTLAADGNFDWVVDAADYGLWTNNFGDEVPGALLAPASVPEPASVLLVLGCSIVGLRRRGRRG